MKTFVENILHQKVELNKYEKIENLPLIFRTNYEIYTMEIGVQHCLLIKPSEESGLVTLRKQQKRLEKLTGQYCVLYLTKLNSYSRDKMLEEGIPFIWEDRQIYMPFLGVLLNQNESRELRTCSRLSFLTQKLLLVALYQGWKDITVTMAAQYLNVSKMSITRCFDEIESLEIPVLERKNRSRVITGSADKRKMWETIKPFMRNPLIKEYYLQNDIGNDLIISGFSALAEYSMLDDNSYSTYAITKPEVKEYRIKEMKQIPKGEEPGCVVQELGYSIAFKDKKVVDPLTVFLLLEEEGEDPRVGMALEKMLEDYVW